jgi:hypothetical protein
MCVGLAKNSGVPPQAGFLAALFPARTERYVRAGLFLSFGQTKERKQTLRLREEIYYIF